MLPIGRLAPELDWNLLRIFSEIVKAGGVSRAADRLCLKQPTVSLALKRLEETLGMVLCKRGPGGFELTDAGALVSETCGRMIEMVDGIPLSVANMRAELRGRIRLQVISGMVNTVFDQAIAAFHGQFPRVEIAIEVSTWDAIGRSLLRHEADIGVAPARFFHAELTYQSLFLERHRPYCGCSHPLFGRRMASARDLGRHAFILTAADEPDDLEEELEALHRELARLPFVEREVLTLFYLRELSMAQIAEALQVPVGTVKSRLFRARRLLRAELESSERLGGAR